jgi:hypothetical protein
LQHPQCLFFKFRRSCVNLVIDLILEHSVLRLQIVVSSFQIFIFLYYSPVQAACMLALSKCQAAFFDLFVDAESQLVVDPTAFLNQTTQILNLAMIGLLPFKVGVFIR